MVLEMALDLAGRSVERNCRGRKQIVARPLVTHPRPAITGAPKGQIGCRIVGAGDPHRAAARLPLVTLGPSLAARLSRRWHRIRLPNRRTGLRIECGDKPANAKLSTRDADKPCHRRQAAPTTCS